VRQGVEIAGHHDDGIREREDHISQDQGQVGVVQLQPDDQAEIGISRVIGERAVIPMMSIFSGFLKRRCTG
jgi:hypothetical protein